MRGVVALAIAEMDRPTQAERRDIAYRR